MSKWPQTKNPSFLQKMNKKLELKCFGMGGLLSAGISLWLHCPCDQFLLFQTCQQRHFCQGACQATLMLQRAPLRSKTGRPRPCPQPQVPLHWAPPGLPEAISPVHPAFIAVVPHPRPHPHSRQWLTSPRPRPYYSSPTVRRVTRALCPISHR